MIFKVKVDNFWLDEENLSEALQRKIANEVVKKISESIQPQIDTLLLEKVNEAIGMKLEPMIDDMLMKFLSEGVITPKKAYNSATPDPVTIEDHMRSLFQANTSWNAGEQIKNFAKKFGEDLKLQYNAAFANQIVSNMKEQGFLKDEVTQILLGGKSK